MMAESDEMAAAATTTTSEDESLGEHKRMKLTAEVEDPDEIEKCPVDPDEEMFNAFIAQYNRICTKYRILDDRLAGELRGNRSNYEEWSQGPFIDMQYKEIYEYLKNYYFSQVTEDKAMIEKFEPSRTQEMAEEFALQFKDGLDPIDEWNIRACLKDLADDINISEELELLKKYELFLLDCGYWKNGEPVPTYKDYTSRLSLYLTGYYLTDVQHDFEKWIFKLTDEEKRDAVECDHRNRKANLRICTRAHYILKKLESAENSGIISMEILKRKIRERFRGPQRQDMVICGSWL